MYHTTVELQSECDSFSSTLHTSKINLFSMPNCTYHCPEKNLVHSGSVSQLWTLLTA